MGILETCIPDDDPINLLQDETFLWIMVRRYFSNDDNNQMSFTWKGFFQKILELKDSTTIAYGPIYPHSPTNPDAVQTSLDYFVRLTELLEQEYTIVNVDQAIYDIVKGGILYN